MHMICSMYIVHINCAMYNAQFFNTLNCFALLVVAREYNFEAVSRHKLLCAMVECKGIQCWSTTQATLSKQLTGTSYSALLNTRHKLLCPSTGTSYSAEWQVRRAKFPVCLPEHRSSQNCKQVQSWNHKCTLLISQLHRGTILKPQLNTVDLTRANFMYNR